MVMLANPPSQCPFRISKRERRTMGSTRLWFPSLKSVASHLGALSMVLFGHWRSGRFKGWNFLYFFEGSLSLQRRKGVCQRSLCLVVLGAIAAVLWRMVVRQTTYIGILTGCGGAQGDWRIGGLAGLMGWWFPTVLRKERIGVGVDRCQEFCQNF